MESNQSAARSAKRFLEDRIRNDWAYPNVPQPRSASDEEVRDAQGFRERYYGESEASDSTNDEDVSGPYKFDNPDSIADTVAQTQRARRRRRKERLDVEMKENEGLRIWVERRDLWTGAASVRRFGVSHHVQSHQSADFSALAGAGEDSDDKILSSPGLRSNWNVNEDVFDMVPVAPRMLADNPIRASVTPKAYSDIFQKIVLSSRTPSVPINLADMTKALVQGWKENDEWPPKPAVLDPLVSKKRGTSGSVPIARNGGFIGRHPHLEKSVDSVRRIFHLDGHHHNSVEQVESHKDII